MSQAKVTKVFVYDVFIKAMEELTAIYTSENDNLRVFDLNAVANWTERKKDIATYLELQHTMFNNYPEVLEDLPVEKRELLKAHANQLREVIEQNNELLSRVQYVNDEILKEISTKASEMSTQLTGYNQNGIQKILGKSRYVAAMALNENV